MTLFVTPDIHQAWAIHASGPRSEHRVVNIFLMMCYFSREAFETAQLTPDNTAHPGEDTLCLLGANWPSKVSCRTAFTHITV